MNTQAFYQALLHDVEQEFGNFDACTITGVIGVTAGGPLSVRTIGRESGNSHVTYVSCELALNKKQAASSTGRYEIMMTCDDREWCHRILAAVADMSLETSFDHGHTLDIGPWVDTKFPVQGVLFERHSTARIRMRTYSVMQLHGVSRPELEDAVRLGVEPVLAKRKARGSYPRTNTR